MERHEEVRLIGATLAGDRDAADALVRAHQGSLYAYLLRMCGRADVAEDLVQEAFVRALTNLARFDPRYRFSTWLFTIATRLAINAAQKRRPVFDTDIVESRGGDDGDGEAVAEASDARSVDRGVLAEALAEVSVEQRCVLILHHQQEWPIAVIAEHLDMPVGTVKSHLHRGRARLTEVVTRLERRAREAVARRREGFARRGVGGEL